MEVTELLQLSKAGVAGIMLALIGVIILVVRYYHTLTTNHISHSNELFQKNVEIQTRLVDVIEELRKDIRARK